LRKRTAVMLAIVAGLLWGTTESIRIRTTRVESRRSQQLPAPRLISSDLVPVVAHAPEREASRGAPRARLRARTTDARATVTGETSPPTPEPRARALAAAAYAKLPLSFERNEGQTDPRVEYLSRGRGYSFFLTPTEAVWSLQRGTAQPPTPSEPPEGRPRELRVAEPAAVVRMKLVGGNPGPAVSGLEPLAGTSHYYIGNDPSRWQTDVPQYAQVSYRDVYPGVDLVYHGKQRQLEYDFVVSPGADPTSIRLRFEGPKTVTLDEAGNLVLEVDGGHLLQYRPSVYQEVEGHRRRVAGNYVLRSGEEVGFEVGAYDPGHLLVIDPVLAYSTYLGGGDGEPIQGAIAIDGSGSAYVTGQTLSTDFPTLNPYQTNQGGGDIFVAKLAPSGSSLVYATYLGGSSQDQAYGIAVDASGSAYVTGSTFSTDFPTMNPYQTYQGGDDAFVTKLSPTGSSLAYSTYLGGEGTDVGFGIAIDGTRAAYVAGWTMSTGFPTSNQYEGGLGNTDAFVTKVSSSGSGLVYSTRLGGGGVDAAYGVAIDGTGSAYVAGQTSSTDFPTVNPFQTDQGLEDVFVAKLSPSGSSLTYSTYLGGGGGDDCRGIAVDGAGSAYVTGTTSSADFPTQTPYQTDQGGADVFAAKLSPSGSSLVYSTYLGGSGSESAHGIAIDASGSAYLTGSTSSTDFPTLNPYQTDQGATDAFLTKLSPSGSSLAYSTYLGGGLTDQGWRVAVDGAGTAYVTGATDSADFPTVNPFQTDQGLGDAFALKLVDPSPAAYYTIAPCRAVDTRNASAPLGGPTLTCSPAPLPRSFPLGGACGVPVTARAVSYNVAVTQPTAAGHLRLFPAGGHMPSTSSINYVANATRGNNGIVLLGTGYLNVSCHQSSGTAHVIIDVNGYFE